MQVIFHAVGQARAEHLLHGKRCVVGFLSHAKSFSSRGGAQDAPGHAAFTAVLAFLKELMPAGAVKIDMENEVIRSMLVAHDGRVVSPALPAAAPKETP